MQARIFLRITSNVRKTAMLITLESYNEWARLFTEFGDFIMQARALLRITRQPQKDGHASNIRILQWKAVIERRSC